MPRRQLQTDAAHPPRLQEGHRVVGQVAHGPPLCPQSAQLRPLRRQVTQRLLLAGVTQRLPSLGRPRTQRLRPGLQERHRTFSLVLPIACPEQRLRASRAGSLSGCIHPVGASGPGGGAHDVEQGGICEVEGAVEGIRGATQHVLGHRRVHALVKAQDNRAPGVQASPPRPPRHLNVLSRGQPPELGAVKLAGAGEHHGAGRHVQPRAERLRGAQHAEEALRE